MAKTFIIWMLTAILGICIGFAGCWVWTGQGDHRLQQRIDELTADIRTVSSNQHQAIVANIELSNQLESLSEFNIQLIQRNRGLERTISNLNQQFNNYAESVADIAGNLEDIGELTSESGKYLIKLTKQLEIIRDRNE